MQNALMKADLELKNPTMTPHIHPLAYRHHDLYTHEPLPFNLDTDLNTLLQSSGKESEVGCVIAVVLSLRSMQRDGQLT